MPAKKKKFLNINKNLSRKDFLKKIAVFGGAAAGLLVMNCPIKADSGGDSSSGSGVNSGGTDGTLNFSITFSKAMDKSSTADALSIIPASSAYSKSDLVWTNGDKTVSYSKPGFDKIKTYTIMVAGTAKDASGNSLDGNKDGTGGDAYSFTTV